MKPYRLVPIEECGEALVALPSEIFAFVKPHPYEALGAPYEGKSPFYVRQGVCDRLVFAQNLLQAQQPGWKIQIFDAFRPLAVQQFMVEYTFTELVNQRGLIPDQLTNTQRQEIYEWVYKFWALPDPNPNCPPPHSTGGAIDVTLIDEAGQVVDMGSAIDEISLRSYPNYFANSHNSSEQTFHQRRTLLYQVMTQAGFKRHENEWWHFCYGDQLWAWLTNQENPGRPPIAHYGRVL